MASNTYDTLAAAARTTKFTYKIGQASYWPPSAPEHNKKCMTCAARTPTIGDVTYCAQDASSLHDTIVVGSGGCDAFVYPHRYEKEYKDVTIPAQLK